MKREISNFTSVPFISETVSPSLTVWSWVSYQNETKSNEMGESVV